MPAIRNSAAWHARYAAQSPSPEINHAVTIMEYTAHDRVSRKVVAAILYHIWTHGTVYGGGPAIGAAVGVNEASTIQALGLLREFGLIIAIKENGVTRYAVDLNRLADPSRKRCVDIARKPATTKGAKAKKPVKAKRCKCGCLPERWIDGQCLLCHTRECIANGTV